MTGQLAAREGDSIGAHAGGGSGARMLTNALAWGAIGAAAVGVVVGAVIAAPVVIGVGTVAGALAMVGGTAGISLGVVGGALSGAATGIRLQGEKEKTRPAKLGGGCGKIIVGSPNVFIENKACARDQEDTALHGVPRKLNECSST